MAAILDLRNIAGCPEAYQRVFQIAEYTEKSLTGKNGNLCLALTCLLHVYYYDTIVSDTCVARHNCEVFLFLCHLIYYL